jgi:hypothetical protein
MQLRAQIIERSQMLQQVHSPQTQSVQSAGSNQGSFLTNCMTPCNR